MLTPAAESAVKEPLSVAPNNPLYSPYLRTPLPVGLWAYNYLYTPKEKGFKYWFYKRLAKQPVLISKVQPQLRTKVAEQVLENYGYFGSRAADSLLYRKRGRKAKVRYTLGIAPAWHYSSIAYPQAVGGLKQLIDSLQATSLLRVGRSTTSTRSRSNANASPSCSATGATTISVPNTWSTWPTRPPADGRSPCA